MRILVTGANGFIGKYLTKRLKAEGHCVFEHSHETKDLVDKGALSIYKDIDIIYHLAAKTFVPESWNMTCQYISGNNAMLINVLEYCREYRVKLVFISTYLYGEPEYLPVDEIHKCVPNTPYHLCKKIGEEICEFYNKYFGIDIAILRPFNVYGYGQNRSFLLPKVYEQASGKGEKIEVFNLFPKRDYLYAEDLVDVLVKIIPCIKGYDVYNVGSGKSYSVKEVIEIIQKELGTKKRVIENLKIRKNEIMDCFADISKLESKIGMMNITSLQEGIHRWHIAEKNKEES